MNRESSFRSIRAGQLRWARGRELDPSRSTYMASVRANLFTGRLSADTCRELQQGDGSELQDSRGRPAKMRALMSSSVLAINFFDPWRGENLEDLGRALGLPGARSLRFEYKPMNYPVRPRSPNVDLLLSFADGSAVGVECKFTEPFRASGKATLSPKYFPVDRRLWAKANLPRCQALAQSPGSWSHLDVSQLLKHILGLAHDDMCARDRHLLYLWFDTGLADAAAHQSEIQAFADSVQGDAVAFRATTYQTVFAAVACCPDPLPGWRDYMMERYFGVPEAV